jgi:hypothetical protein
MHGFLQWMTSFPLHHTFWTNFGIRFVFSANSPNRQRAILSPARISPRQMPHNRNLETLLPDSNKNAGGSDSGLLFQARFHRSIHQFLRHLHFSSIAAKLSVDADRRAADTLSEIRFFLAFKTYLCWCVLDFCWIVFA